MKNIWYRGACLIIKRFKFLKNQLDKTKKWSYMGFTKETKKAEIIECQGEVLQYGKNIDPEEENSMRYLKEIISELENQ